MKIIIYILTFFCLIFSSQVFAGPLFIEVVSDDNFPPFSYSENEKVTGIDIDIINEMGRRLNIKFNINLVPWKRLIMMTETGRCDASMSLFRTPERELFSLYTSPIHYSTYVIFVKKGKEFNYSVIQDLFGKTLCKQSGFAISDEFDRAVKKQKIKIFDVFHIRDSMRRTFMELNDGFVANKHVALYKLKNDKKLTELRDKFTILPKPVKVKRGAYFVLSKASKIKNKVQLQETIRRTLKSMEESGIYQKIINNYIN